MHAAEKWGPVFGLQGMQEYCHAAEKWGPVFGLQGMQEYCHAAEKWGPVFGLLGMQEYSVSKGIRAKPYVCRTYDKNAGL